MRNARDGGTAWTHLRIQAAFLGNRFGITQFWDQKRLSAKAISTAREFRKFQSPIEIMVPLKP
jgi:hypothetical protein